MFLEQALEVQVVQTEQKVKKVLLVRKALHQEQKVKKDKVVQVEQKVKKVQLELEQKVHLVQVEHLRVEPLRLRF